MSQMTLTRPATRPVRPAARPPVEEDRYLHLLDPAPGTVVEMSAGSCLRISFRRGLGASRWQVAAQPGHLLLLASDGFVLTFLVFEGYAGTLRLERRHPERGLVHEVRELGVAAPAEDAHPPRSRGIRPSRSA